MSKASREFKAFKRDYNILYNQHNKRKDMTLKKYKSNKRKIKKRDSLFKKRDRNFYSLYRGDINFKNSMDKESATLMEDLRVY